jgi:hypothetical protein
VTLLIGILLVILGLLGTSAVVNDYQKHGQMYLEPRTGGPMPQGMQIFMFVLIGIFLLGGLYLVAPQAAGLCRGVMP